jgi:hypothetical protein
MWGELKQMNVMNFQVCASRASTEKYNVNNIRWLQFFLAARESWHCSCNHLDRIASGAKGIPSWQHMTTVSKESSHDPYYD